MRCRTCKVEKPESEYNKTVRGNRIVICRECQDSKERIIRRFMKRKAYRFGWSLETLLGLLEKQKNRCQACERKFNYNVLNEVIVDYNPSNMTLYGFLCRDCKEIVSVVRRRVMEPEKVKTALSYCNRTIYKEEKLFLGTRKFTWFIQRGVVRWLCFGSFVKIAETRDG